MKYRKLPWPKPIRNQAPSPEEVGLVEALRKIANYETAGDGEKYVNHEQGWHGVAAFAQKEIDAYEAKRKEGTK